MRTMKLFMLVGVIFGTSVSTFAIAESGGRADGAGGIEATKRTIVGIITAADSSSITIHPRQGAPTTGRIGNRTVVTLDGRAARPSDLMTDSAQGQLGLDDVWSSISAISAPRRR
jgi:hypothetical protein